MTVNELIAALQALVARDSSLGEGAVMLNDGTQDPGRWDYAYFKVSECYESWAGGVLIYSDGADADKVDVQQEIQSRM